jgi:hypothetical protein
MEKSKKNVVDGEVTIDELNNAILEILDDLDKEYGEKTEEVSEEEKVKRKSIWNKISD